MKNPIYRAYESSIFCSYPGNDKLKELFLSQFQLTKALYENNMCKQVGKVLPCDHTFIISKHVGVTRQDDGKFLRQFENVFLALNENGEVMAWRFTKSTSFSEILDLLKDLKCRLDKAGVSLEMVLVDDCCHVKNLYEQIFPGAKIRLDLFHACMRIVQTIPKGNSFGTKFSNELSLIFRQDGDLGDERKMPTACPIDIEANLERLLFVCTKKLNKECNERFLCGTVRLGRTWNISLGAVKHTDNGRTDLTWGSSEEHRLAARHSLLNAKGTESLFLVSRTVNQQGLSQIWNSLVFFIVDTS